MTANSGRQMLPLWTTISSSWLIESFHFNLSSYHSWTIYYNIISTSDCNNLPLRDDKAWTKNTVKRQLKHSGNMHIMIKFIRQMTAVEYKIYTKEKE